MKYTHRSTECNDLRFQFPKFRLVKCLNFLSRSMYRALNERATDWLKWISGKQYKHLLSQCHSPKHSRESCFTLPFNYAYYIKSALRKKQLITSNAQHLRGNTKNISFQFHYGKFSQQKYSTRSYYYMCVTRGRKGDISHSLFQKLKKNYLILRKSFQILPIYW